MCKGSIAGSIAGPDSDSDSDPDSDCLRQVQDRPPFSPGMTGLGTELGLWVRLSTPRHIVKMLASAIGHRVVIHKSASNRLWEQRLLNGHSSFGGQVYWRSRPAVWNTPTPLFSIQWRSDYPKSHRICDGVPSFLALCIACPLFRDPKYIFGLVNAMSDDCKTLEYAAENLDNQSFQQSLHDIRIRKRLAEIATT